VGSRTRNDSKLGLDPAQRRLRLSYPKLSSEQPPDSWKPMSCGAGSLRRVRYGALHEAAAGRITGCRVSAEFNTFRAIQGSRVDSTMLHRSGGRVFQGALPAPVSEGAQSSMRMALGLSFVYKSLYALPRRVRYGYAQTPM
jgi:hypothetical protein